MQVPRLLLTVCAVTICAGFISVRANDTPEQAAARAALEQKMRELDAQESPTNTAPAAPQNEATPPSATATSTPPAASNTEPPAGAQAALEQKMREMDTQEQPRTNDIVVVSNAVVVVVPPQSAPGMAAPPAAQPAMMPPPDGSSLFAPATPASSENAAQAAARVALEQNMTGLNGQGMTAQPASSQTPSVLFTPSSGASGASAGNEPGYQPMVAPPLPISADKQAQLQALNARYFANLISPEEYFKQRAQILAAP
jgi:hypothetical protein